MSPPVIRESSCNQAKVKLPRADIRWSNCYTDFTNPDLLYLLSFYAQPSRLRSFSVLLWTYNHHLLVVQKAKLRFQNLTHCQVLKRLLLEFFDTINQLNIWIYPFWRISWIFYAQPLRLKSFSVLLCTYNHHRYHVDNSYPADIAAGKNQEIKLVYCVKEFQQKSRQRLTVYKILKPQFGF